MSGDVLIIKRVAKGNLRKEIDFLFGELNVEEKIKDKEEIFIKPNFCCPEPANTGATVDLDVLGGVIDYFVERDKRVMVGETGSNHYNHEMLFQQLGLYVFCSEHNAHFINLNVCEFREAKLNIRGRPHNFLVPIPALEADFFVNVPKYKSHGATRVSLAMKNLYGLLPDKEKWKGHALGLNETLVEVNRLIPSDLVLTDGIIAMQGFGPTMGLPVKKDVLIASNNAIIHDFGICQLQKISGALHIKQAVKNSLPKVVYYFYDIDRNPISQKEINLSLKLMPRVFTLFWYKINEKYYAAAPMMEKRSVPPKKILQILASRKVIDFFRKLQGGITHHKGKDISMHILRRA